MLLARPNLWPIHNHCEKFVMSDLFPMVQWYIIITHALYNEILAQVTIFWCLL